MTFKGPLIGVLGLTPKQLLGLSVLAALVTTVGSLIATWSKDFVFVRSFERWKERRTLLALYRRYREQLLLAALDLRSRASQISESHPPPDWLRSSVLDSNPKRLERNLAEDPYFQRYRLISTVYRLCAFLAWVELYRQELTFLDTGHEALNRQLESLFRDIQEDLADGQLNTARDLSAWRDPLIFREEQRAIGECMLIGEPTRTVMGYASFLGLFESAETNQELWWIRSAKAFLLDPRETRDFGLTRLKRLVGHLDQTIALLGPTQESSSSSVAAQ